MLLLPRVYVCVFGDHFRNNSNKRDSTSKNHAEKRKSDNTAYVRFFFFEKGTEK
jgi:hypothetical protein